jgi:hypothetical protein
MNTRTWNLKLMATNEHPETVIEGVSQEHATQLLRGLMYGPGTRDWGHVEAAVRIARPLDRHEGSLAA